MRPVRSLTGRIAQAVVLLCAVSCLSAASADGIFLPSQLLSETGKASSSAQKAIMIRQGGDEVLLLQTTYRGPAASFAWVVPVPARPSEVFSAEPRFLQQVFIRTNPCTVTHLSEGSFWSPPKAEMAAAPPPPGKGAAVPAPVTVLQSLEVGDYKAVILASTTGAALTTWLRKNGFSLPAAAAPVFNNYAGRGWVFVAVKLLERVVSRQPLLSDVAPLGIRFPYPAPGLVFPLTISRLSAPPLSAVMLCAIGDTPYVCRNLRTVWVQQPQRLEVGETYGAVRRRLCRPPGQEPALLCEYSARCPLPFSDLSYRAADWRHVTRNGLTGAYATRLFGLLAPPDMKDLVFTPDPEAAHQDYHLLVARVGSLNSRALAELYHLPQALVPGSAAQAAALHTPATFQPPAEMPYDHPGPSPMWKVVPAAVIAVLVWWFGIRGRKSKTAGGLRLLLMLGLAATLYGATQVRAGVADPRLLELFATVEKAAANFQADTGCYPRTVADLAARQAPAKGLDASGNEVPLTGWRGPYLSYSPLDPIKGPGLVCDVLNTRLVDSGGYRLTVRPATGAQCRAAGWQPPAHASYWRGHPDEVKTKTAAYVGWLHERNRPLLQVAQARNLLDNGEPEWHGTVAIDPQARQGWWVACGGSASPGDCFDISRDGVLVTGQNIGPSSEGSGFIDLARPAGFCAASGAPTGFQVLTPRPLPFSLRRLRVSADACTVALVGHAPSMNQQGGLYLLDKQGRPKGPLVTGQIADLTFTPDGRGLYVLGNLDLGAGSPSHALPADYARMFAIYSLVYVPVSGGKPRLLASHLTGQVMTASAAGCLVTDAEHRLRLVKPHGASIALPGLPALPGPSAGSPVAARLIEHGALIAVAAPQGSNTYGWGTIYRVSLPGGKTRPLMHFWAKNMPDLVIVGGGPDEMTLAWQSGGWHARIYQHGKFLPVAMPLVETTGWSENPKTEHLLALEASPFTDKLPVLP